MCLRRRRLLEVGVAAGITSVSGCLSTVLGQSDGTGEDRTGTTRNDSIGLVLSKGGPSLLADEEDVHSGWVHLVGHGDGFDLTFDVRVCHERGQRATAELADDGAGTYELAFGLKSASETRTPAVRTEPPTCGFGTRIKGSGRLPLEFEELEILAGPRTLRTIPKQGGVALMRPLPDPLEL